MAKIDELLSAVNDLQQVDALVVAKVDDLNQKVKDLTDALANAVNVDPQIEAATVAVLDEVTKLNSVVNS